MLRRPAPTKSERVQVVGRPMSKSLQQQAPSSKPPSVVHVAGRPPLASCQRRSASAAAEVLSGAGSARGRGRCAYDCGGPCQRRRARTSAPCGCSPASPPPLLRSCSTIGTTPTAAAAGQGLPSRNANRDGAWRQGAFRTWWPLLHDTDRCPRLCDVSAGAHGHRKPERLLRNLHSVRRCVATTALPT
jgi:hypothetical protein